MIAQLRANLVLASATLVLCCIGYPLALLALAQALTPESAAGSLLLREDGALLGSRLIAQEFKGAAYFHPRPSAVGYNAAGSGGSNWGASNPKLRERVREQLQREHPGAAAVPADAVTASGSGLDPHLTLAAALLQVDRVAKERGGASAAIEAWLRNTAAAPLGGAAGEPLINVLEANLELDRRWPKR